MPVLLDLAQLDTAADDGAVRILADVLRGMSAAANLALVLATAYALTLTTSRDQQGRFLILLGYGFVTSSSNLLALGQPLRWQLPVLAGLGVAGLTMTMIFVIREWRARRDQV